MKVTISHSDMHKEDLTVININQEFETLGKRFEELDDEKEEKKILLSDECAMIYQKT